LPELPEVETFKRYLDSNALKQEIRAVIVRDNRVLKIPEQVFKKKVIKKSFLSTKRHGKYLFVNIDSSFLIFHFGMSGDVEYFDNIKNEPTHSRILFEFTNGKFLSYISQRMFGKVDMANSMEEFIQKKKLGPDAFDMDHEQFQAAIQRRTAIIKSALMDQQVIAGIGNIYSDEILFQAKIHPRTKINKLNPNEQELLFNVIKKVLKVGIDKKGELSTYPDDFLIPHRDIKDRCPRCQEPIERYSLSQRHGFFCPKCQK